jgi:hypothetical protein
MDTPNHTTTKTCRVCGLLKPITEYYRQTNGNPSSECKSCCIARSKKYQTENADKVRENHRRWREENAEHYSQYHRDWRANNPELSRELTQRYAKTDKGVLSRRASKTNRNAKMRASGGRVTSHDVEQARISQTDKKGRVRCWWCGRAITKWHIDHRIPIAKGGKHEPGNLCLACPKCNMSKQDKLPSEWAGRLL